MRWKISAARFQSLRAIASRANLYKESAGSAFAHGSGGSGLTCSSSDANSSLSCVFVAENPSRARLELSVKRLIGAFCTPIAEEIIAAAVSRVLIVIEGSSTTTLRARGNCGAQPRHYVVVLKRFLNQLAILRRAAGR